MLVAEELLEDLDRRHAEVAVAKRDEQVVLQAREYLKPAVQLLSLEILLQTGREDLYMRPLEILQVVIYHILLQGLSNIEGVPLVRGPKSPILLCVSPGHVHFLLGARQRLHFQDGRADVVRRAEQHTQVRGGILRVEIDDLRQINQANLDCSLRGVCHEYRLDDLKKQRRVETDGLLANLDVTRVGLGLTSRAWRP